MTDNIEKYAMFSLLLIFLLFIFNILVSIEHCRNNYCLFGFGGG